MNEVSQFHNLSHIFISLIGATLLLAIYYNIRKRFKILLEENRSAKRLDKGLLYLSFGLLIWVLTGTSAYLNDYFDYSQTTTYQASINLFSTLNNLFWLLALFYFNSAPKFIYQNEKNVKLIIVLIIIVASSTLLLTFTVGNTIYNGIKIIAIPDVLLTTFLCYLLAVSFYKTFILRGLKVVAFISIVIIILLFYSQLSDVFISLNNNFNNQFIRVIAKTSLVSIFLVLATSWVIELSNTPISKEIKIRFTDWSLVTLNIPSKGIYDEVIDFGSKTTQYKNLLSFAYRRKHLEASKQAITVNSSGEIKSQTYLTRIIDNINNILNLEDTEKLQRKDLITFIGESKYRLRVLPENITIDKALLSEFLKE